MLAGGKRALFLGCNREYRRRDVTTYVRVLNEILKPAATLAPNLATGVLCPLTRRS